MKMQHGCLVRRLGFYLFVLLPFGLCAMSTEAEIYRWVDADGKVHFSDEKPEKTKTEEVEVRVNSFEGLSVSDSEFLDARVQRQVVMYSASWCGYCRKARHYFRQKGIPFKEYDIENSRKGRRDYARMNGSGVPIIFVGNKRIQGFRAERFQAIYDAQAPAGLNGRE
jgi:glutaredoxin